MIRCFVFGVFGVVANFGMLQCRKHEGIASRCVISDR